MIYELTQRVATEMTAKSCPFPVLYGPERMAPSAINSTRVVIMRDRQGSEAVDAPRTQQRNPKAVMMRGIPGVLRVYATSTVAGAAVQDHEDLADQIVDLLLVAIRKVVTTAKTMWRIVSAGLLSAEALQLIGLETWPGVVYEMKFVVDRGVMDAPYTGEPKPEATLAAGSIVSSTHVSLVTSSEDPEVACGEDNAGST